MSCSKRMSCPKKRLDVDIDSIDVYPGQILTVWANTVEEPGPRRACQVEVRVNPYGIVEIFYNEDYPVVVDTFYHYYRMENKEESDDRTK